MLLGNLCTLAMHPKIFMPLYTTFAARKSRSEKFHANGIAAGNDVKDTMTCGCIISMIFQNLIFQAKCFQKHA